MERQRSTVRMGLRWEVCSIGLSVLGFGWEVDGIMCLEGGREVYTWSQTVEGIRDVDDTQASGVS